MQKNIRNTAIIGIVAIISLVILILMDTGLPSFSSFELPSIGKAIAVSGLPQGDSFDSGAWPGYNCYISYNNNDKKELAYRRGDAYQRCESLYLAHKYSNDLEDFYMLLKKMGYDVSKEDIVGKSFNITYKKDNDGVLSKLDVFPFNRLEKKLSSDRCETIYFFRLPLYCFNGKADNLYKVIPALTILKAAGTEDNINSMKKEFTKSARYAGWTGNDRAHAIDLEINIEPFDFMVDEKIILVDASKQTLLNREGIYILHCGKYQGFERNCFKITDTTLSQDKSAEYYSPAETKSGKPYTAPLNVELLRYVTIIYPDNPDIAGGKDFGLEIYQASTHKYFGSHTAVTSMAGCPSKDSTDYPSTAWTGDEIWATPYGALAETGFQFSQNPLLSCIDRQELYFRSSRILQYKLCYSELCKGYSSAEDCAEEQYSYEKPC